MTKRECAIISAYTGIFMGSFDFFHQYVEEIMGRPIFTHELASKKVAEEIKEKSKADFIKLCDEAS